jgi:repressor LexA
LDVLRAITRLHQHTGWMPTVREIGGEVGLSSSATVHHHLARLERDGLIERRGRGDEAYRVTDLGRAVLGVTEMAA